MSVGTASKEIENTMKKMQDKKGRVAAAEAKAAGKKAERVPAARTIEKKTLFDLDWSKVGAAAVGELDADNSDKLNLTVPYVVDGSAALAYCQDNTVCAEYVAKFVIQACQQRSRVKT